MQGNEINGGAERFARDAALEAHVTAIMDAVAVADTPAKLREFIHARLVAFYEAATGLQVSCDTLADRVRKLILSGEFDYNATDEGPEPSEAWASLEPVAEVVHCAQLLDDLSYSGASLASVLQCRPWLSSFTIDLGSDVNIGDEGGFSTTFSMDIGNVVALDDIGDTVPEDLQDESGSLDVQEAAADLYMDLLDDLPCFADAVGVSGANEESDRITVDRSSLQDLLDAAAISGIPISGSAVARRLWPAQMARATECRTVPGGDDT